MTTETSDKFFEGVSECFENFDTDPIAAHLSKRRTLVRKLNKGSVIRKNLYRGVLIKICVGRKRN
jgi:hypothetical protein